MRVLIVDDDPMIRDLLEVVVTGSEGNHRVVGSAADAETAVELAATNHPDVIITDLVMDRRTSSSSYLSDLGRSAPDARIVIFSGHTPAPDPLPAGAHLYLLKPADPLRIMRAVSGE